MRAPHALHRIGTADQNWALFGSVKRIDFQPFRFARRVFFRKSKIVDSGKDDIWKIPKQNWHVTSCCARMVRAANCADGRQFPSVNCNIALVVPRLKSQSIQTAVITVRRTLPSNESFNRYFVTNSDHSELSSQLSVYHRRPEYSRAGPAGIRARALLPANWYAQFLAS